MSMLSSRVELLRDAAIRFEGYQNGEISRTLRDAAETIESLRDRLQELHYVTDESRYSELFGTPEQAVAATLGSDDRYDAGFASGVQAVFQQLEGIDDYDELQCFIADYWGEGEGNDEQ